ncbi:MAG: polysaccharide biosynthesis protein [Actinobacteria bacterium]|nr:polysaccharide biosynthesis protein [Actinomycetota bacterium]
MVVTPFRQLKRQPLAILVDACIVVNAYTMASLVLFAQWAPLQYYSELLIFLPIAVVVHCGINLQLGLYRGVGRYAGLSQGLKIIKASVFSVALLVAAGLLSMRSSTAHVLAMVPVGGAIAFIFMSLVRFYPRVFYERSLKELDSAQTLLIVGAGSAGEMILRSIQKEPNLAMQAIAFVDDKPDLDGLEIHGVPIYSPTEMIPDLVARYEVDEILIAIPSASLEDFQRIWQICFRTGKATKTLRPLQSIHLGKVGLENIREIDIEDVLGRQPVQTDYTQVSGFIDDRVVLVTGAGGSIGSELVMQISHHNPANIILVDQDETALYRIHEKLSQLYFHKHIICVTDVKSETRMEFLFRRYQPDLVFHAAAYKHVPLMEIQPDVAVLNNVHGTWNMARISAEHKVECFVNISTDKAVEPVNVLGATKLLGERVVSELGDEYPDTKFCSVRFGNVLGSRGSVIPIFQEQIHAGGPVTITHPEMTRYFMLISEAVDLVLQAAAFNDKNAIFVLEMGKPVRIVDLAEQMISLMRPGENIDVIFTGLRPGEKLHEQLIDKYESRTETSHEMIYKVSPLNIRAMILSELPDLFYEASSHDGGAIKALLEKWIPSYSPFDMSLVGSINPEDQDPASGDDALPSTAGILGYRWNDETNPPDIEDVPATEPG